MNWWALLWMVLLLAANGFFVAAEFAYLMARRETLAQRRTRPSRAAVRLSRELSLSLAAAQLGITMASLLLGFVAEPAVAHLLENGLGLTGLPEGVVHTISLIIALLIVVFLHMVVGEMAPKNISIATPERAALVMSLPFRAFVIVFRPVIAFLNGTANGVLRLMGIRPVDRLDIAHSAEDLATIISAGRREGVIEDFAHRLLTGAILFRDRDASEVMIARPDVYSVTADTPVRQVERIMEDTGHSRLLVHTGDLDDALGFIHLIDLLGMEEEAQDRPLDASLIRPLLVVPEMAPLHAVLANMRRTGNHLAIVVDEHGGTAGIITLRDIVQELIGGLRERLEDRLHVTRTAEGARAVVPGGLRPADLQGVGLDLPEGDYETIGGLVMDRLGRIPRAGDVVQAGDCRLRVLRMERRRVKEVEVCWSPKQD